MSSKIFLLFALLAYIPQFLAAQSGLELVHADKSIGKVAAGEEIHIFSGHVMFRQDTLEMFCDEATLYEKQDKLEFKGKVFITDGKKKIQAGKIDYFTKTKDSFCYNAVKIKSKMDSLYAEYVKYNFKTDIAYARENLFIYDEDNIVRIWGFEGRYDPANKHSSVIKNTRFTKIDTASSDTLVITAQKLDYFGGEEPKAYAIDSVTILQGKLKAVCDSAVYFTKTELVSLNINPNAWYEDSEMNGNLIEAKFDSLDLKGITVTGSAKAISLADSIKKKYNELKGKIIYFDIENDQPKKITAVENASSIYYLKDEKTDQGTNYATSDTIIVFFTKGELDSISIKGGSEGIFYPSDYKGTKVFEDEQ
jgi:lipopolysaccharide export system protein LptA